MKDPLAANAPHGVRETTAAAAPPLDRFIERCAASLATGRFVKLLLAKHHGPQPDLQRVMVRAVSLKGEPCLSFVYRHTTRDVTKNLSVDAGWQTVRDLLGPVFRNAHLHTAGETVELTISQRGVCTLRSTPLAQPAGDAVEALEAPPAASHDREKQRWVDVRQPFLTALGVTTAQHDVVPAMSRKWKQINKFVEVFAGALRASGLLSAADAPAAAPRSIRVVDFGSGKGYLTFAVHDHLRGQPGIAAQVTGVELRGDLVRLGNAVAQKLGLQGLRFDEGDVSTRTAEPIDVMIALHACDTATDHAIHHGLRGGAAVILCSPCCHKQLRPQLLSPHPLRPILQHGVHLGQHAEMLTDGLRALLLEACGYDTQVFEFVALEHTQKNKMILAVRRPDARPATASAGQIDDLKAFYGIREHCLETLLRADGLLPA
ncbi:MAG: methyltransferase [Burkholderiales bacterium 28-67-8]|nr:MAG: methyltransferase [Burkholderiales bacterium 28-67-8]